MIPPFVGSPVETPSTKFQPGRKHPGANDFRLEFGSVSESFASTWLVDELNSRLLQGCTCKPDECPIHSSIHLPDGKKAIVVSWFMEFGPSETFATVEIDTYDPSEPLRTERLKIGPLKL